MNEEVWKKMAEFWDNVASTPGAITPGDQATVAAECVNDLLANIPDDELSRLRLAEIGCGEGRLAKHIAPRVASYIGFDISSVALDRAVHSIVSSDKVSFVHLKTLNVFREAVEPQSIDIVVSWTVFMHLHPDTLRWWFDEISHSIHVGAQFNFQLNPVDVFRDLNAKYRFDKVPKSELWLGRWYPEWLIGLFLHDARFVVEGIPGYGSEVWRTRKK